MQILVAFDFNLNVLQAMSLYHVVQNDWIVRSHQRQKTKSAICIWPTFLLVATVCLVFPDLLVRSSEAAACPGILTGHQGALTPVPQVVLQYASLGDLTARVSMGADHRQLVKQSKWSFLRLRFVGIKEVELNKRSLSDLPILWLSSDIFLLNFIWCRNYKDFPCQLKCILVLRKEKEDIKGWHKEE